MSVTITPLQTNWPKRSTAGLVLLSCRVHIRQQTMFGGPTFMVGGTTGCAVDGYDLRCRLDPEREDEALARPHARPMDLTGRPLRDFLMVEPAGLKGERR